MRLTSKQVKVTGAVLALLLIVTAALTACGSAGMAGPAGPSGPAGPAGPAGADAVAPMPATISVTPSEWSTSVRGLAPVIAGSGFKPGEQIISIWMPLAYPYGDDIIHLSITFDPTTVNEQGAFSAIGSFSSMRTANEGAYSLFVEGNEGSKASYPIVIKAPAPAG
ncbi:hypothetical protein ACFLU4_00365 [Chloroflexota bacterium]